MSRKMIGVGTGLHESLASLAKKHSLPMTVILETMVMRAEEFEWESIKKHYDNNKPTWTNMRKVVDEYKLKYPQATDEKLSEMTGFSLAQVETLTHSAHKRCMRILVRQPRIQPKTLATQAKVSEKFAKRIWDQAQGVSKIPKTEEYLWTLTGSLPIPNTALL